MEKKNLAIHSVDDFKGKIYTIRGVQVMLDSDVAEICVLPIPSYSVLASYPYAP